MNFVEVIHQVLGLADSDVIGLPGPPDLAPHVRQRTAEVLDESRALIGTEATQSDYFKCSEDRFATLVGMALTHLQPGSRLLDIGNAPGYLAIMLANAGFDIDGINLSEAWNSSYPDPKYVEQFRVKTSDIEKSPLPYPDAIFDAIVFTEVLEHIAIKHPRDLLPEFRRVLRPNGVVVFSTPNVCNVSNVVSLLKGNNIFWDSDIFYGDTDRHNREFTPREVRSLFESNGFVTRAYFGMNDHANWRSGSAQHLYDYQAIYGTPEHGLMRNTIVGVFGKASG
jgi:2-polyprenyl-3-methyl-5-hydroxy-6-metoxy-1,4-benzoquinol methylase